MHRWILFGELFPTALRGKGVSLGASCAHLGGILSPLFGFTVGPSVAFFIWGGSLAMSAAALHLCVAEPDEDKTISSAKKTPKPLGNYDGGLELLLSSGVETNRQSSV